MKTTRLFKVEFYTVIMKTAYNFTISKVFNSVIGELVVLAIFLSLIIDVL